MAYDSDRRLNYLDDEVTSRLGAINATGRGTISIADGATSGTATITAVVTARTQLRSMGWKIVNTVAITDFGNSLPAIGLTNTTTITASCGGVGGGSRTLTVGYEYTEYAA